MWYQRRNIGIFLKHFSVFFWFSTLPNVTCVRLKISIQLVKFIIERIIQFEKYSFKVMFQSICEFVILKPKNLNEKPLKSILV